MFDINKDDGVGFADLVKSVEKMQLVATKKDCQIFFQALGLGKHDVIDRLHRHCAHARSLSACSQHTCMLA